MEWQKYLARLRYYDRMCGNLPMVHQKIAQVQAVVKAYSRHEIPQEVPKLSFSAHYLELHMTKHPELFELVSRPTNIPRSRSRPKSWTLWSR